MAAATLRAVGGSVMVAIPKPMLNDLGLKADSKVDLTVENGRLVVEAVRSRLHYDINDLVAQCDGKTPFSEEDRAWLDDDTLYGSEEF